MALMVVPQRRSAEEFKTTPRGRAFSKKFGRDEATLVSLENQDNTHIQKLVELMYVA